jgi:regulator of RNase E activity RraA
MNPLSAEQIAALRRFDSCSISNAIETFNVRLRNEGFTGPGIQALFPNLPPVAGYAVTARFRTSGPPPRGHSYYDRTDWWNFILSVPPPRIVVLEDVTETPGLGAICGEVHASILKGLGCSALITNGAVRDLNAVAPLDFQIYSGALCVSHSYAHIVALDVPVEIAGLPISTGDLLHGDRHGVLQVPHAIAPELPARVERMLAAERRILELCRSDHFSLDQLRRAVAETTAS